MIWMIHLVTTQSYQSIIDYIPHVCYILHPCDLHILKLEVHPTWSPCYISPTPYIFFHLVVSLFPLCMSLFLFCLFVRLFHLFIFFSTQWIFFHFFKIEVHFFPEWAVQACIPTNSVWVFPFLHILPTFIGPCLVNCSHSNQYKVVSCSCFYLYFSDG